jgi:ornithine cyclodeaminase/alanine dehydrogenase-like protein (mu-crystallin family)
MKFITIEKPEISNLIKMGNCIEMCEKAYALTTERKFINFPRIWLKSDHGGLLGVTYAKEPGYLCLKLLSNGFRFICLLDYGKETFVLMDGGWITDIRTGAGAAVSAKYLARKDSKNVGVIGTGNVARHALWAICEEKKIEYAKAYSRNKKNRDSFETEMHDKLGICIDSVSSVKEAVNNVDIVITATKAIEPVLKEEHIQEGMHICALGNQPEVDPNIFLKSKVFLESLEQSKIEGKLSYAISSGKLDSKVNFPELGEVILGKHPGRETRSEITLFDCQGLIAQDAIPAWEAYRKTISSKNKLNLLDFGF